MGDLWTVNRELQREFDADVSHIAIDYHGEEPHGAKVVVYLSDSRDRDAVDAFAIADRVAACLNGLEVPR